MVTLDFVLTPEATVKIHDFVLCLAKFSESVYIEARHDRLAFTALNSSKSAYASFALDGATFFSKYQFAPTNTGGAGRFTCRIYNKALLSVFKGRLIDGRGRDTAIERCEVSVHDGPDKAECRLIVKMVCRHGVTKTYKLTYESVEVMHALFDKASARNRWRISSRLLKEFIEYFGQRTEQLDFYYDDGRAILTSYTEQIKDGKEILKQPLHTQVSVDVQDFEEFDAEEKTHIIISVKDFKSIVTHADTLKTGLSACYSNPNRPLQFSYQADGMHCEFTLATSGDYRATPAPKTAHTLPSRAASRQQSTASAQPERRIAASKMAPPPQPSSRSSARQFGHSSKALRPPSAQHSDPDPESLFMPPGEEDRRWDPTEYRSEEDDMLGWDASADNDIGLHPTFRDSGTLARVETHDSFPEAGEEGLAPTQRLSQMHGLFS